jgi:hypothetical protein
MCTSGYKQFKVGQVYTVECHGTIDWGLDYRSFRIEGESLSPEIYNECFEQIRMIGIEKG